MPVRSTAPLGTIRANTNARQVQRGRVWMVTAHGVAGRRLVWFVPKRRGQKDIKEARRLGYWNLRKYVEDLRAGALQSGNRRTRSGHRRRTPGGTRSLSSLPTVGTRGGTPTGRRRWASMTLSDALAAASGRVKVSNKRGTRSPGSLVISPGQSIKAGDLENSPMQTHNKPNCNNELYDNQGVSRGLRTHYSSRTAVGIGATVACPVVAQQGGRVNMLCIIATLAAGGSVQGAADLGQITVNSMPLNFGTVPAGNALNWGILGGGVVGRYIGDITLNNNDTISVPVANLNAAAIVVTVEAWYDPHAV